MNRATLKRVGLFMALMAASLGGSCRPPSDRAATDVAYNRVLRTGTLRVAYISYGTSFTKDPNTGNYSGIMHDALEDIARRMGLRVEYVAETAWGTMVEEVSGGRVDLVCTGLWPNATRGKYVDFTEPVYFSPVRAYVRVGNRAFDSDLSAINSPSVRIATVDGEMTSIIAAADFPRATADAHPQTTDVAQMLMEVATRRAAVTFVEPAIANAFLRTNTGTVEPVRGVDPLRVFPNVFMIAKGESKLLSMLNTALEEAANTGALDRIVQRYESTPGEYLRRQVPYRLGH